MSYLCELEIKRDGVVCRKLVMASNKRIFTVYEQTLKEDNIDKKKDTWDTAYLENFPNRELARIFWMGRVAALAYEEGGSEGMNPAIYKYATSMRPQ